VTPSGLFPIPTPEGIRQLVMAAFEGGLALGRLFANAVIDFVSSIGLGIA